jgi:hypothetical protein
VSCFAPNADSERKPDLERLIKNPPRNIRFWRRLQAMSIFCFSMTLPPGAAAAKP